MMLYPEHAVGTYAEALVRAHVDHADRPALGAEPEVPLSYAEVGERAARLAGGLAALGARAGDRILLAVGNSTESLLIERAVMLWGFVRVAVSPRLHPDELSWIARDCDARVLVVEERHLTGLAPDLLPRVVVRGENSEMCTLRKLAQAAPLSPAAVSLVPGDPAAIMYTSGTTGRPKGAATTQRAWASMANAVADLLDVCSTDVLAHAAPASHFSGSVATGYSIRGARIVALPRFNPDSSPQVLHDLGVTCVPMVPTMIGDLVNHHADGLELPHLRWLPYGGSVIAPSVLQRATELLGARLVQFYGASEALIPITVLPASAHATLAPTAPVPVGGAAVGVEIRLEHCDDSGAGELLVRGDRVMSGYWMNPDATADALDADGWYHSGDVAVVDEEGRYVIIGRRRDVIISGGFNVYPGEVERVIVDVPGVREVSVVGIEHPRWGEAVAAAVVADPSAGLTAHDIIGACRARLADFKKPVRVLFLDALPKTSTGKVSPIRVESLLLGTTGE